MQLDARAAVRHENQEPTGPRWALSVALWMRPCCARVASMCVLECARGCAVGGAPSARSCLSVLGGWASQASKLLRASGRRSSGAGTLIIVAGQTEHLPAHGSHSSAG